MSTTRRRRPALVVLVIVAACGFMALGWWQWTRFEAAGSYQNLGYALQWPLFAGFCVYAYRKFVRYEEVPPEPRRSDTLTEIPAGLLPARPTPTTTQPDDPVLREYNAYLVELAKNDQQNRNTA